MKPIACAALILAGAPLLYLAPIAAADVPGVDDPPGCTTDVIFGLNPQYRSICDQTIQPDGSWVRMRQFWHKEYQHSSCGGVYYQGGGCPPWLQYDVIPADRGPIDTYTLTADSVPPGEPGYLGV